VLDVSSASADYPRSRRFSQKFPRPLHVYACGLVIQVLKERNHLGLLVRQVPNEPPFIVADTNQCPGDLQMTEMGFEGLL
jgi:hypothetical protein